MNVTLSIAGDEVSVTTDQYGTAAEGSADNFESLHVRMDGERASDHGAESAPDRRCAKCNVAETEGMSPEQLACSQADECETCDGYGINDQGRGDDECGDCDGTGTGPHEWAWVPGSFANSASIHVSDDDSISVNISVGDPRGSFRMQIRRMEDGTLILHVPYAGMSAPHMPLTELHPGTFRIG